MSKPKAFIPEWSRRSWHTLDYEAGAGLERSEVKNLEKILDGNPDNRLARLLLAGYYQRSVWEKPRNARNAEKYIDHLFWLIDNEPACIDLRYVTIDSGTPWLDRVARRWQKALRANPENLQVLVNAAHFFRLSSLRKAESLWKRILSLESGNGDYYQQLSALYRLHASDPKLLSDRRYAKKAVVNFARALEIYAENPKSAPSAKCLRQELSELHSLCLKFGLEPEGFMTGSL
jgi:tetratricopeptide (TPR) repeat protein